MKPERILIVNDDGLEAQGIAELEAVARGFCEDVWVVAPDGERSGASHAISLSQPTRAKQVSDKRFAVQGTPADCVILALWDLLGDKRPSLVLSGINHGENLGDDMYYSGTTGAAIQAAINGIPCVAFSQVRRNFGKPDFGVARKYAPVILQRLFEAGLDENPFLNVNFPDGSVGEVRDVVVVPNGRRMPGAFRPVAGADGRNVPYYWTKVTYDGLVHETGTDLAAIRDNQIAITPLTIDMTAHARLEQTTAIFSGLSPVRQVT